MSESQHLPPLPEPSERHYQSASRRLESCFEELRVWYGWHDAPVGRVWLARTRRGLCRLSFADEERFLDSLERRMGLLPRPDAGALEHERRLLEAYFEGRSRLSELSLDLRGVGAFELAVLSAASRIPYGQVISYSELARRIDRPRSQRAVGNALGRNPIAIAIPCHRVVAADGSLGGYTGGLEIKRRLMAIEGIRLERT